MEIENLPLKPLQRSQNLGPKDMTMKRKTGVLLECPLALDIGYLEDDL